MIAIALIGLGSYLVFIVLSDTTDGISIASFTGRGRERLAEWSSRTNEAFGEGQHALAAIVTLNHGSNKHFPRSELEDRRHTSNQCRSLSKSSISL